jgi:Tol biopolymer transport system component
MEDFVAMGVSSSDAAGWDGVSTFTFQDGKFDYLHRGNPSYECEGTYEVVEDFVRITYSAPGNCSGVVEDLQWRLDEDRLHFHLIATQNVPFDLDKAGYEAKPWQKVELSISPTSEPAAMPIESHVVLPNPFGGDDAWIAYQTNRTGEGVWLIRADGTEDHQLAKDFQGHLQLPDWSPDGTKIVMTARDTGGTEPLYEYDLETETLKQLFACEDPCVGDDEPAYSPDGTKVAFIRALGPMTSTGPSDCGLWIGEIASGEVTQITSNGACSREASPRWSPDGSKIAYFRERYSDSGVTDAIFVIDSNGGEEKQLTDWELIAGYPDWSPDGEWIVFATHPLWSFNFDAVVSNLYRMRPDGTGIEQLTFYETPTMRANQPRYTPDGKWILFTAVQPSSSPERRSDRSLWAIPAEGGDPVVIVQGGIYTHGTWQP